MLADITQEFDEAEAAEPVVVVEEQAVVEVEDSSQLAPDALEVVAEAFLVEQFVFLVRVVGRIADAPGAPAGYGDRAVAGAVRSQAIAIIPMRCPMCSEAAVGSKPT